MLESNAPNVEMVDMVETVPSTCQAEKNFLYSKAVVVVAVRTQMN